MKRRESFWLYYVLCRCIGCTVVAFVFMGLDRDWWYWNSSIDLTEMIVDNKKIYFEETRCLWSVNFIPWHVTAISNVVFVFFLFDTVQNFILSKLLFFLIIVTRWHCLIKFNNDVCVSQGLSNYQSVLSSFFTNFRSYVLSKRESSLHKH